MPLQRRVPKFGFKNINRVEYKAINLDAIEALATAQNLTKITVADLRAAGPRFKKALVKILANGAISRALEVQADAFSKKAEEAITAAGEPSAKNNSNGIYTNNKKISGALKIFASGLGSPFCL